MNPTEKMDRFAAFVNDSALEHLPHTVILYRSDDTVIRTTHFDLDRELLHLLTPREQSRYVDAILRELIQRAHASSALFACEIQGAILLRHESAAGGLNGTYPIVRDGGAIRIKDATISTAHKPRFKEFFL